MKTFKVASLVLAVAVATACGKEESTPPAKPNTPTKTTTPTTTTPTTTTPTTTTPAAGGTGTIKGTVKLDGAAPEMPVLDRSKDKACGTAAIKAPYVTAANGMLKDVLVRLPVGAAKGAVPTENAMVDQKDCMYTPYVTGIVAGQSLAVKNSDKTMHNIHTYEGETSLFNEAQTEGAPDKVKDPDSLPEAGKVMKLKCDAHAWMEGWVVVTDHPYFAVSGADGSFEIKNVPAGTYELEAWHPHLGVQKASVTVAKDGAATADFTFKAADYKAPQ